MSYNVLKFIFEQDLSQKPNRIMKKIALLSIAVGSFFFANAQSITPEVIAAAGGHYTAGNAQLSWTIGEPVIETVQAGGNIITQGFHQTMLTVTSIDEENLGNIDVSIYPNPTSDRVIISIPENANDFTLELYDVNGQLVMSKQMTRNQNQTQLDVSQLATSYYMLRLVAPEIEYSSTHKIQKTGY